MSTTIDRDRLVPPPLNDSETEMVKTAERMIMACLDHSRAATITIESDDVNGGVNPLKNGGGNWRREILLPKVTKGLCDP